MTLIAIQHHPSRFELVRRLIDGIHVHDYRLVADPGGDRPDPWRGYRACLELLLDDEIGCEIDHLVVIQDDATVCDDFDRHLDRLIELQPDVPIVLWLAAQPRLSAMDATRARRRREPFSRIHYRDWIPAVAVVWPVELACDVLEWAETRRRPSRSDDHMLGEWARARRQTVLAAVPSIVQHPDDVPSLIGNGRGAGGRNPARVALHFPPDALPDLTASEQTSTFTS